MSTSAATATAPAGTATATAAAAATNAVNAVEIIDGSTGYVLLASGMPEDATFLKIWSARAFVGDDVEGNGNATENKNMNYHAAVLKTHKSYLEAGATYITFHPDASTHVDRSLQMIRDAGCKSGLVFNPHLGLDALNYVMDKVDMVLLMSVNPGFGGQSFIPPTRGRLREARAVVDGSGLPIRLEIDGGVTPANIGEIAAAGADTFVAGSAIFNQPDYAAVISEMRSELAKVGG